MLGRLDFYWLNKSDESLWFWPFCCSRGIQLQGSTAGQTAIRRKRYIKQTPYHDRSSGRETGEEREEDSDKERESQGDEAVGRESKKRQVITLLLLWKFPLLCFKIHQKNRMLFWSFIARYVLYLKYSIFNRYLTKNRNVMYGAIQRRKILWDVFIFDPFNNRYKLEIIIIYEICIYNIFYYCLSIVFCEVFWSTLVTCPSDLCYDIWYMSRVIVLSYMCSCSCPSLC